MQASGRPGINDLKKRRRSARACLVCRERKVKCDVTLTYPDKCSNCVHFDIDCLLPEPKKRSSEKVDKFRSDSKFLKSSKMPDIPKFIGKDPRTELPELYARRLDPNRMLQRDITSSAIDEYYGPSTFLHMALKEYMDEKKRTEYLQLFHLNKVEYNYLEGLGCFHIPDEQLFESYIDSYFRVLHPQLPVINKQQFLEDYLTLKNPQSLLLLQSVLFAGSRVYGDPNWTDEERAHQEKLSMLLNRRAKALFEHHVETEPIPLLQSMIVFGNYWDSHVGNTKNGIFLNTIKLAASTALCIGLNRNFDQRPELSIMEKNLYKRIWWAIFIRDTYSSFTFARPFSIDLSECEVPWPTRETLVDSKEGSFGYEFDTSDLDKDFFLHKLALAKVTRNIMDNQNLISKITEKSASTYSLLKECDMLLYEWIQKLPDTLKLDVRDKTSPPNFYAACLALEYHTVLLFIHRSNIVSSSRPERASENLDALPSWSVSFKAAYTVMLIGEYFTKHQLQEKYNGMIIYSMWSAGTMMVYHLYNKDPKISEIAHRSILACINVLAETKKKWPMADFVMFSLKMFLTDKSRRQMLIRGILNTVNKEVNLERRTLYTSAILDESLRRYEPDERRYYGTPLVSAERGKLREPSTVPHITESPSRRKPALLNERTQDMPPGVLEPSLTELIDENWLPSFDISGFPDITGATNPDNMAMSNLVGDLFGVFGGSEYGF
ncbi:hypothetical protein KL905_002417 [Ogataea polymorpha]|nr:hypothetical protein KL906_001673 [Ogataea polymorpha]KAG7921652.1 hypothetical protein KL905_002417 [Ogataea polymorpha]KAG7934508.1 hypothetical protein KL934_002434 [Ogataea polymorpha]